MASICGSISKNLALDCLNPQFGGVESTIYLFNYDDILTVVKDVSNPLVIRDITMKTGKKGYSYEGFNKSNRPLLEMVKKTNGYPAWKHTLALLIMANTNDIKKELMGISKGAFVAVVVNKQKSTDAAIEIYGIDKGLILQSATRDPLSADNNGAYDLSLASDDGDEEPNVPASFAKETAGEFDYVATQTALMTLITA